jgi:allantoate deiminase
MNVEVMMKINLERIKRDLETLATFNTTPGKGVTRSAWSTEEKQAKVYLRREMEKANLEVFEDGIGTMFGRREGTNPDLPVVMVGSHYDSVRNGGAYDGAVGTVAALETMRILNEMNFQNRYPIEMIAMNAEEGETFGPSTGVTNSRAMVGTLTYKELDTVRNYHGQTKREAMAEYGIVPNLEASVRPKGSIKNFIEMHIEQGPVLEDSSTEIGLVEYLPGIGRYRVIFTGEPGDSTVLLSERKDALLAASMFAVAVNDFLKSLGDDITGAVSQMDILPNSNQFVADKVDAKIEIRTFKSDAVKNIDITACLRDILCDIHKETSVHSELIEMARIGYPNPTPPSVMDQDNVKLMQDICDKNSYKHMILNNGTGHDAMIMTDFTATNMVYVPSHKGITHHPDEFTSLEDIGKGAQVVLELVAKLANKD